MFYRIITESLISQPSYLGKGFPSNRELKKMREKLYDDIYDDDDYDDIESKKNNKKKKDVPSKRISNKFKKFLYDAKVGTLSQLSERQQALSELPSSVKSLASSRSIPSILSSTADFAGNVLDTVYGKSFFKK